MLSILYYLFLALLCFVFMVLSFIALIVCYPFDRGRRVVHECTHFIVRVFFGIPPFWRQKIEGLENIDRKKQYVIVVNHNAMLDIPALYCVPLNFRWVSKQEVFRIPFFGQYLMLHGDICINRGRAAAALEQLIRDGKWWISHGASIAIFPEGTRSKTGEIQRFKAGAFSLAKEAGVEILPVVLDGTQGMFNPNRTINWRHSITVRVLPPVSAEHIASTDTHELIAEVHASMCSTLADIRK